MLNRMLLTIAVLAAMLAAAPAALACAAGAGPYREAICADPALRRLDGRIRATEAAIAAVTPRPATLAAEREAFAAELAEALRQEAAPGPTALATLLQERLDRLTEALRLEGAMRREWNRQGCTDRAQACPRPGPALESRCIVQVLRNCRVEASGSLAGADGRPQLVWQSQQGFTGRDGLRAGIIVLARRGGGWVPLTWAFEGSAYAAPRLVRDGDAPLLHVAGRSGGTGRGSADLLYRQHPDGRWQEVETLRWQAALQAQLPPGLAAWQGVSLDPAALQASLPLWREDDAMCCPQGGRATVSLRIEGDGLAIGQVRLDATARAALPPPAACPAERARYRGVGAATIVADLLRAGPGAGAASDLVLRLHLPAPTGDLWFRFTQAVGYGSNSLLPVHPPGPQTATDGIQDIEVATGLEAHLPVLSFAADMQVLPDPPRAGQAAPRHLLLPGLGSALHYGLLPQQAGQAEALRGFPTALWSLDSCRDGG